MLLAVSGEVAAQSRVAGMSHTGDTRYQTYFIGHRHVMSTPDTPAIFKEVRDFPQCHVSEMSPGQTIRPHFHETNQYQVMAAGSATLEGKALPLVALHYGDHHTVFGDLTAGPEGMCLFTMCAQTDPGGIYLHQKGAQDLLKPSKRRSLLAHGLVLSPACVLQNRGAVALENLFAQNSDTSDGLGAFMLRMGAGMKTTGPDPKLTGGQFCLVLNGSLHIDGANYPNWSAVYADPAEAPLELRAGARGVEALVMNFPREHA